MSNQLIPHPTVPFSFIDPDNGFIMPNYTEQCLNWLKTHNLSRFSVFEYGAGLSTIWWRLSARELFTIENDEKLANIFKTTICFKNQQSYISAPTRHQNDFDIIVINGPWRDDCTKYALKKIKNGGYIIINNYFQPSAKLSESLWTQTQKILEKYPVVMFYQPGHEDFKTALFQIIK